MRSGYSGKFKRIAFRLDLLRRHESGVSATEFALFAPILVFGLLMMVDVGFLAYQRMTMDHVLRAGAQSAMMDPGASDVLKVLELTAAENFTVGSATPVTGKPPLTLSAERYCACPDNPDVEVVCSTVCTGLKPSTLAYYSLSASRVYSGIILPGVTLEPNVQVQVR